MERSDGVLEGFVGGFDHGLVLRIKIDSDGGVGQVAFHVYSEVDLDQAGRWDGQGVAWRAGFPPSCRILSSSSSQILRTGLPVLTRLGMSRRSLAIMAPAFWNDSKPSESNNQAHP